MLNLGSIIAFLLSNIEIVFVIIVVVGGVLSTISKAGKTLSDQQRRVMQDMELQRRRLLEEQARLEADPNTQSYRGYLDRTRPEKLEDLYHEKEDSLFTGPPGKNIPAGSSSTPGEQQLKDFQADILAALGMKGNETSPKNAQDALRGQLAQKMGRTASQPSQAQVQQTVRSKAKSITTAPPVSTGITSSLAPEMTAQKVTLMTDSNAGVANSSIQVKLEKKPRVVTSNSTQFGTTNDVVRGIIWSEILGKPKSARR
jgi:hypothetical protein